MSTDGISTIGDTIILNSVMDVNIKESISNNNNSTDTVNSDTFDTIWLITIKYIELLSIAATIEPLTVNINDTLVTNSFINYLKGE